MTVALATRIVKHTPGPWSQSHRRQPTGVYVTQVYDAEGETICDLAWFPVPTEHAIETSREANARLIAAAPDMLVALKTIMGDAEHGQNMSWTERCTVGRAAIAKAEGR